MTAAIRPRTTADRAAGFLGDWLVSEYCYTPAGEYVGVVRQRRCLQPLAAGVIRVTQICAPLETADGLTAQAQAVADALNRRVGAFVFDLQPAGQARRYLGPDVLGSGFAWREGALTARGLWPRFGYNFTSFSLLLHPERQVTGGKFYVANRELATIVGAAAPEAQGYPQLAGVAPTALHGTGYRGLRAVIAPDGRLVESVDDDYGRIAAAIAAAPGREQWYGPLREVEAVTAPGETHSLLEIHDQAAGAIAGLGRRFRDEKLCAVEVYILTNKSTDDADGPHSVGASNPASSASSA